MTDLDTLLLLVLAAAALLAILALACFLQMRAARRAARSAEASLGELRSNVERVAEKLRASELREAAAIARAEHLAPLVTQVREAHERIRALQADIAARDSRQQADSEAFEQRMADMTKLRGEMEKDFRTLANAALGDSRQAFLALADEVFKKHRAETNADVEARQKAVEELVRPIGETLAQTRTKLEQIEKERADSFGQIRQQLASVGQEAARLTHALKSNPGTRGRWGEESLRNALELAGLSKHCDFDTQHSLAGIEAGIRPDCIIRLPGGRHIVVDAKTPLASYLDAVEATDEPTRLACLKRHSDSLRQHMLTLTRKEYAQAVSAHLSARPDFVAMYIPGENFFAAAIERNGELFSEAIAKGVFIVTPITLIALAKAIALGWRQEDIAENAREVAKLGRELYDRLCRIGDHVQKLGRGIEGNVKLFNTFVGSLETSVMPQARRFRDLGVTDASKTIDLIPMIESEAREPVEGRDLVFEERLPFPGMRAAE
jgi:DNA recombination protein RmuC